MGNSILALRDSPVSAKPILSGRYRWPELPLQDTKCHTASESKLNLFTHPKAGEPCPELRV